MFESDIEAFFLLIPLIWLFKLLCLLLSSVGQPVIFLHLTVGHVIVFVLWIAFNFAVIYAPTPAVSVFLFIKRARGDEISLLSIIFSVICTVLYYLFRIVPPFA